MGLSDEKMGFLTAALMGLKKVARKVVKVCLMVELSDLMESKWAV
jgi:hypothetical protein